jgi:hypothetical protein
MLGFLDTSRVEVRSRQGIALIDFPTRSLIDRGAPAALTLSLADSEFRICHRASPSATSIGAHDTLALNIE